MTDNIIDLQSRRGHLRGQRGKPDTLIVRTIHGTHTYAAADGWRWQIFAIGIRAEQHCERVSAENGATEGVRVVHYAFSQLVSWEELYGPASTGDNADS